VSEARRSLAWGAGYSARGGLTFLQGEARARCSGSCGRSSSGRTSA
jgi:hypothetical protein